MSKSGRETRLTDRQRRFVEEYLVDLRPAAAALRAGYNAKYAVAAGNRVKNLPHVRAAIEEAMGERSKRLGITQDRVVLELARIAFADIREFVDWDAGGVTLRASRELTPDQTACVAEIVENAGKAGKGLRIKLHGKTQALAALARHLGGREAAEEASGARPVTVVTCVPPPDPLPETSSEAARGDGGNSCAS
ncbi:Terminase small subunit [Solidesulfovibrio fructosivorans JJ]]|uniref:Terminase small subunit n=1 Tax=Solidesulfovibrio fructosivorans JJ] TaxID=596151 RepID=E1JVE4_SOLFR|nr:terminase small subunit [Solidesulfovibrio fructosivorans]EFL51738.1 Terminase small subunit [Solidesulfovibrio fructosivorans JJ]]